MSANPYEDRMLDTLDARRAASAARPVARGPARQRPLAMPRDAPDAPQRRISGVLSARALKVTTALDPRQVLALRAGDGPPRVALRIEVSGRVVTAEISAQSARRAKAAIRERGPENVACILQGQLAAGDVIEQAGLSAQPKGPGKTMGKRGEVDVSA